MNTTLMAIIYSILISTPTIVLGWTGSCTDTNIVVHANNKQDSQTVCYHLDRGRAILAAMGLMVPKVFTINLTHKLPTNEVCHMQCIGFYDVKANVIHLLDYEAARRLTHYSQLYANEDMSTALWGSFMVHELAHVAVANTTVNKKPLCLANEYIASVAQIEALPDKVRGSILRNYRELRGFEKTDEMTLTYCMIDPGKFIVNSYLHYRKPENGLLFIKQILREGLSCDSP